MYRLFILYHGKSQVFITMGEYLFTFSPSSYLKQIEDVQRLFSPKKSSHSTVFVGKKTNHHLVCAQVHFFFQPFLGAMIPFDKDFSNGLVSQPEIFVHIFRKKNVCSLWASEGRRGVRKTPDGSSNASPSRNFLPRGARIQLGRHRLLLRGKGPWVHSVKSWPYMGVRAKIISISAARRVGSTTLLGFFEDF